jgi:integrase
MGIKKLGKNKYHARYFAGLNSKGKRVYPSKTFNTNGDATKWLTAKLREKHLGEYAEASTIKLADYLDQWLIVKKSSIRENTHYTYSGYVNEYVRHEIGHLRLSAIRSQHIEQWQAALLNRVSARTVVGVRAMLGSAFQRALRQRILSRNPVREAETVKFKRIEKLCFDPNQALTFMAECRGVIGLLLKFMLNTGLRPEEVVAIRWRDLETESKAIVNVRQVVLRLKGGGWRCYTPKTRNSVRRVGLPKFLIPELKEHRKQQLEERMKMGCHYQDHDLAFATRVGTPYTHSPIRTEFKATLARAGLNENMRVYDLRHSFVTLSLAAGVDLKTVSEEAGHATVAFTLDHYGHVLQVMRDAAVEKREAFWASYKK